MTRAALFLLFVACESSPTSPLQTETDADKDTDTDTDADADRSPIRTPPQQARFPPG